MPMVDDEEAELERPHVIDFTPEAKGAWIGWFDALAEETAAPDFPERHAGAWSRLRSHHGPLRFDPVPVAIGLRPGSPSRDRRGSRGDALGRDPVR
jgi:hypothetical protein